jgi:hypothetical protein
MRVSQKILIGLVLIIMVGLLAKRLGWFGKKETTAENNSQGETVTATGPIPLPPIMPDEPKPPRPVVTTPTNPGVPDAAAATTAVDMEWEQKVDAILTSEAENPAKAQQILELLPKLPEEGQIEAAQHVANLIPDENYASAAQLVTNALTPQAVLDVLIGDLLNRPNNLKLPLLLDVAKNPTHPWREESKVMLELYVEKDFGDDWVEWDKAVQTWLKENPDQ